MQASSASAVQPLGYEAAVHLPREARSQGDPQALGAGGVIFCNKLDKTQSFCPAGNTEILGEAF